MQARLTIDGFDWRWDPQEPIDISIPLLFTGPQPNAYGVEPASSEPCRSGDLIGDTRQGGSCNFERYTFIPHCNGTHTECVGHITHERVSVRDCLGDALLPAWLISVQPVRATETSETYASTADPDDLVITRDLLASAIGPMQATADEEEMYVIANGARDALIIRTLPNDESKIRRRYADVIPPYFTSDAMNLILECGFAHLLVDLPSIDRLYDEGKLSNHRIFWDVEPDSFETNEFTRRENTVTELVYVPNDVPDGRYILNLQIAPFAADASPSRPILFRVSQV